jgi:hypothetical protein
LLGTQNGTARPKRYGFYEYIHSHDKDKANIEAELRGIKPIEIKKFMTEERSS